MIKQTFIKNKIIKIRYLLHVFKISSIDEADLEQDCQALRDQIEEMNERLASVVEEKDDLKKKRFN